MSVMCSAKVPEGARCGEDRVVQAGEGPIPVLASEGAG